jgi:hypothetical protein
MKNLTTNAAMVLHLDLMFNGWGRCVGASASFWYHTSPAAPEALWCVVSVNFIHIFNRWIVGQNGAS